MPSMGSRRSLRRLFAAATALILAGGVSARQAFVPLPVDVTTLNRILVTPDFDNDGIPDSVLVEYSTVRIVLSGGDQPVSGLGHGASVVGLVAEDVDHDGDPDILTLTAAGKLWLWRNDGRGRFAGERVVPVKRFAGTMTAPVSLAQADEPGSPGDSPGWGWHPPGLTAFRCLVSAPGVTRPGTAAAPAASLDLSLPPAAPRAPPRTSAVV